MNRLSTSKKDTRYAIFAKLTAANSLNFGSKSVDDGWGNSKSVTVYYVHVGNLTAKITGTNASDFSFSNSSLSQSKTVVSGNTNSETSSSVTVYFNPSCSGTRTATLTFSGNGLTKTVTLTGTGTLQTQSLSWNNESNIETSMLKGSTQTISATSTEGAITYSSDATSVMSVNATTGVLTANGLGTAVITATAAATCKYDKVSITKTFTVKSKDTPYFTPNGFSEGSTCSLKVGDKVTMTVSNVSEGLTGDFKATATKSNGLDVLSFTRSGNTITIEAINAGNSTATFTQTENSTIFGATKSYSFSVSKHETKFTGSAYNNLKVDETQIANYTYTNTSAAQPTASDKDDFYYTIDDVNFTKVEKNKGNDLVTFDPATKKITACNAGTAKITLHQKPTYKYTGATTSFNVTVTKHDNSLNCSWGSWSKDMYVDSEVATTISATANPSAPIIKVIKGDSIAELKNNKVKTNCNLGVAQWSVTQEETYKYKEPTAQTLTVNVKKESDGNCEVTLYEYSSNKDVAASKIGELPMGGVAGVKLYYSMKVNGIGKNANLSLYNSKTGKWEDHTITAQNTGLTNFWNYDEQSRDLADANGEYHITKIQFGSEHVGAGTDDPYINNIKVTCQKYFNLQDDKKNNISNLEMTNYVGGNSTTATFYVNYSTCADEIKIKSNNAHVTVSPTSINTSENHFGRQEITVTYAANAAEDINAVITAYTKYENQTLNVHAATVKIPQDLTWSEDFEGDEITLPLTFACNDAATASTNLPVKYSSGDDKIIEIAADSLSFTIIGAGTTTLTATQAGNDLYQSVSGTKTITATSKKVQVITWSQNLNRAQNVDDEITLKAQVKVFTNIATGEMEYSEARTKLIKYSCPANNKVIEITKDSVIRIIGFGTTTITANVNGDNDYEAATPMIMPVRIREKKTGDCEASLAFRQDDEIEFYQTNTTLIGSVLSPQIIQTVEVSDLAGVPDLLTFDVRGKADEKGNFQGDIEVYESTDGGVNYGKKLGGVTGVKDEIKSSKAFPISSNVTTLKFVRPQGGKGYHYVGNIQITSKPFIRMAKNASTTVNLGNIALGAVKRQNINIEYSSAKGNLNVTTAPKGSEGLTVENQIDVECGVVVTYPLEVTVAPTSAGSWSNTITIADPKQPTLKLDVTLTATITKGSQEIVWNPSLNITTLQAPVLNAYATSGLEVSYEVTDGDDVASIVNGQVVIAKDGEFTITVTQNGNDDYNAAEDLVKTFTVSKATPTLVWANAPQELACNASGTIYKAQSSSDEGAITYAITAGSNYATINATTGELTILQFEKEITIQASQAESVKFNAPEPITVDVTIAAAPEENTFTNNAGDNNWNNPANWEIGFAPIGETPNVVINGDLDIEGNDPISVGDLTINTGKTVIVKDGATLVVNGESQTREAYGNIIVEAGGQLILGNGEVHANDFTLYSNFQNEQPKSGQVSNPLQLTTHGEAYFILDLDPSGSASYGWYSFTVPFPVDAMQGVYRLDNGNWVKAVNEVNYAIMDYHEDLRAQGKYGWKKYRSILQPGTGYLMTVENALNTYRFTKTQDGNFNTAMTQTLNVTDGDEKDKGWNSIGNGTTSYVTYASTPRYAQLYNHSTNAYDIELTTGNALVVGAAYFVQATTNNSTITMQDASDAATGLLRAPQRDTESDVCFVNLSLSVNGKSSDKLFVTCDDNAAATYTIGKDVMKMGATTGVSVARIWANAKGTTLGAADIAYSGNEAIIPLGIYAPKDGEYTLSLNSNPMEDVYLTRNGVIVWNLSMSDYTFTLEAGSDTSYALQVVRRVQNTATGVDAIDNDKRGTDFVEKMIVNGQLFILRDGILYDAQGKKVSTL